MTRKELIARLEELTNDAMRQDETMPAAAVLSTLLGALVSHSDVALMELVGQFSRSQMRALQNQLN